MSRVGLFAASTIAYVLLYVAAGPLMGPGLGALSAVVVVLGGYLFRYRTALIASVGVVGLNFLLRAWVFPDWVWRPDDAVFAIVLVLVGWAAAAMSELRRSRTRAAVAEAAARASAESAMKAYRQLLDEAPYIVLVHSAGRVKYANKVAAAFLLDGARDSLVGVHIMDLIVPEDYPLVDARMAALARGESLQPIVVGVRASDRSMFAEMRSVQTTWEGEPSVLSLGRDVTRELEETASLLESHTFLERAQALGSMGCWKLIVGESRMTCTPQLLQLLGLPPGKSITTDEAAELLHPRGRERVIEEMASLRDGSSVVSTTASIVRPDGERRILRIQMQLDKQAAPPVFYGVAQDVTEIERAQQALSQSEKLSALGALVAGVAHEINNPLGFMQGNVELAQMDVEQLGVRPEELPVRAESLRSELAATLRGIQRIATITQSLKQVAKRGDAPVELVDPNELMREIAVLTQTRIAKRFDIQLDLRGTSRVYGRPSQLSQVLLNLALNAVDAVSGRAEPAITLRTILRNGEMALEVEDNGVGIGPEAAIKIFEPFFTTKPGGTGLGLSISQRIAADHGGSLTFRTTPGVGTTFVLTLPTAPDQAKVSGSPLAKSGAADPSVTAATAR